MSGLLGRSHVVQHRLVLQAISGGVGSCSGITSPVAQMGGVCV